MGTGVGGGGLDVGAGVGTGVGEDVGGSGSGWNSTACSTTISSTFTSSSSNTFNTPRLAAASWMKPTNSVCCDSTRCFMSEMTAVSAVGVEISNSTLTGASIRRRRVLVPLGSESVPAMSASGGGGSPLILAIVTLSTSCDTEAANPALNDSRITPLVLSCCAGMPRMGMTAFTAAAGAVTTPPTRQSSCGAHRLERHARCALSCPPVSHASYRGHEYIR